MTGWINFAAVGKILVFGLLLGAGLPATFAMAVRLNTVATADGAQGTLRRPVLTWLSWALIALVVLVALLGVL
jgi:hypothetical protein